MSPNASTNRSKRAALGALWADFRDLGGFWRMFFFVVFRSAKTAPKNRWMLALGRPGAPQIATQLRQGSGGDRRFGHLAPQGGARARVINKSIKREETKQRGSRSNTPWAEGPANLILSYSPYLFIISFSLFNLLYIYKLWAIQLNYTVMRKSRHTYIKTINAM